MRYMSKYRNQKCSWKGIVFDSILERDRFIILEADQREGKISDLRRQVKYVLSPEQRIGGKLVERECSYIADFVYKLPSGEEVVEDTKGFVTKEFIIKRKLVLSVYGIRIRMVRKGDVSG